MYAVVSILNLQVEGDAVEHKPAGRTLPSLGHERGNRANGRSSSCLLEKKLLIFFKIKRLRD